jgi:SAM-dependent methyltransferase
MFESAQAAGHTQHQPDDLPGSRPGYGQRPTLLIPARVDTPELLDLGEGTADDVKMSLDDLWRINRFFGGVMPITNHLFPRLRQHSGTATVLDVGTGSAQMAVLIARWAARNGCSVKVIGLDLASRHLAVAAAFAASTPNVKLMQADALHFPLRPESVDYVISSLFLHHFEPEQVISLLRQTFVSARRGVILSDLERGRLPLLAFRLMQPILARSYLTRHDGAASVRRSYTPCELSDLARAAGLTNVRVVRYFPWRMTLVAEKDRSDP